MKSLILILCFFLNSLTAAAEEKFSEHAWKRIEPIYNAIWKHPFNQELFKGKLSKERFEYYSNQDGLYLKEFAKALGILATKLDDKTQIQKVMEFVQDCLKESPVPEEKLMGVKMNPANFSYTNFLLATAAYKSREELAAALLPCFWVYLRVTQDMMKAGATKDNPYYQNWIEIYAGEKYANDVEDMIEIVDSLAAKASPAQAEQMLEAFVAATRLEWYFWDGSYNLAAWKP